MDEASLARVVHQHPHRMQLDLGRAFGCAPLSRLHVSLVRSLDLDQRLLAGESFALAEELFFRCILSDEFGLDMPGDEVDASAYERHQTEGHEANDPEDDPQPGALLESQFECLRYLMSRRAAAAVVSSLSFSQRRT